MSKYKEELDLLKCNSEQYIANHYIGIKMETRFNESDNASKLLQELITKHEKLREYLIEEYNKVLTLQGECKDRTQWEKLFHYGNGIRYALYYLDKEDSDKDA